MQSATNFVRRVFNRPAGTDSRAYNVGPCNDSIAGANYTSCDIYETASTKKGIPIKETPSENDSNQEIGDFENDERQVPRTAGFIRSFSSIVCIVIGTGCLQIPYAFAKTGWIGIIIIVLSALIGSYTGVLTIRCLYYQPGKRLHSFPQIGRAAFGAWGQYASQFFISLYSLGITCVYIILAGQFIHGLVVTLGVALSEKIWMVIVAVVMWIPVAILKQMSEAAFMAIFGLVASVVVIVISTVMSLKDPYTKMHPSEPAPSHSAAIGSGIPVALSSIVFSFSVTAVYPHVEAAMKKPRQWPMVALASMLFSAAAYLLIGITGYWAFGD
ncbi:hypothetical protein LPJ81_004896 [Coemansia sp. IMI 209127]|nr:hypothetical protein LPJ81_004896 [Coemansia sp. IMI 209127]